MYRYNTAVLAAARFDLGYTVNEVSLDLVEYKAEVYILKWKETDSVDGKAKYVSTLLWCYFFIVSYLSKF